MGQTSGGLEQQTVPQFMLTLYDHLKESEDVLKEIGVCSTSPSQLACFVELPLPSLYSCLQLFASWVRDGVYDFAALPLGLKIHLSSQDLQSIEQIPCKWTGREGKGGKGLVGKECEVGKGTKGKNILVLNIIDPPYHHQTYTHTHTHTHI